MLSISDFNLRPSITPLAQPSSSSSAMPNTVLGLQQKLRKSNVLSYLDTRTFEGLYSYMLPIGAKNGWPLSLGPAAPGTENRICAQPATKLHRLSCMHYVWTEQPEACAPNCLSVTDGKLSASDTTAPPFACLLCHRIAASNDLAVMNDSHAWTEVLLETQSDPESELTALGGFRNCIIAYLARDGTIMPVRDTLDAALVRVLWNKRDESGTRIFLRERPGLWPKLPRYEHRNGKGKGKDMEGVDETGFDYGRVPKGPVGASKKTFTVPTDLSRLSLAPEGDGSPPRGPGGKYSKARLRNIWGDARKEAKEGREGRESRRGTLGLARGGLGRGSAMRGPLLGAGADTMDVELHYGDEGIAGSAAGVVAGRDRNSRRKQKEEKKVELERKRQEMEEEKRVRETAEGIQKMELE